MSVSTDHHFIAKTAAVMTEAFSSDELNGAFLRNKIGESFPSSHRRRNAATVEPTNPREAYTAKTIVGQLLS